MYRRAVALDATTAGVNISVFAPVRNLPFTQHDRGVAGMFVGATFGKVPDVSLLASMKAKTGQMAGDWGKLTAVFTGFTQLSIVVRGRYVVGDNP